MTNPRVLVDREQVRDSAGRRMEVSIWHSLEPSAQLDATSTTYMVDPASRDAYRVTQTPDSMSFELLPSDALSQTGVITDSARDTIAILSDRPPGSQQVFVDTNGTAYQVVRTPGEMTFTELVQLAGGSGTLTFVDSTTGDRYDIQVRLPGEFRRLPHGLSRSDSTAAPTPVVTPPSAPAGTTQQSNVSPSQGDLVGGVLSNVGTAAAIAGVATGVHQGARDAATLGRLLQGVGSVSATESIPLVGAIVDRLGRVDALVHVTPLTGALATVGRVAGVAGVAVGLMQAVLPGQRGTAERVQGGIDAGVAATGLAGGPVGEAFRDVVHRHTASLSAGRHDRDRTNPGVHRGVDGTGATSHVDHSISGRAGEFLYVHFPALAR